MKYSIDEIYDLFMWDTRLSDDKNEAKAQKGIDACKEIKNLYPFIQPIVVPPLKSKPIWEPCAKVISAHSDEELQPFIFKLLEWIADPNWPGALIIYDRLRQMSYAAIEPALQFSKIQAQRRNDSGWLAMLDDLKRDVINGQNSWGL